MHRRDSNKSRRSHPYDRRDRRIRPISPVRDSRRLSGHKAERVISRKRRLSSPPPHKYSERAYEESNHRLSSYKMKIDEEITILDAKYEKYSRNPRDHPFYDKEYQLFWNRKADELAHYGKHPSDYDLRDEWKNYFARRMIELYDQEYNWKVEKVRREFGMSNCDNPPIKRSMHQMNFSADPVMPKSLYIEHSAQFIEMLERSKFSQPAVDPELNFFAQPNLQAIRTMPTKFDQPVRYAEIHDHPKFKEPLVQKSTHDFSEKNSSSSLNSPDFISINSTATDIPMSSRIVPTKRSRVNVDKALRNLLPTIKLENVPLSMDIIDILDFFNNKLRTIVGCSRVADYITKVESETVLLVILEESEIEMMINLKEIYMEGNLVKISSEMLLNGTVIVEKNDSVPGAPESIFLANLEKRSFETTSYLRELAKLFDKKFTLTGIRITREGNKRKLTRTFGFATFLNKASVDEYEGRKFKLYDYEVECRNTANVPLLIPTEHAAILENDSILWSEEIRSINAFNA